MTKNFSEELKSLMKAGLTPKQQEAVRGMLARIDENNSLLGSTPDEYDERLDDFIRGRLPDQDRVDDLHLALLAQKYPEIQSLVELCAHDILEYDALLGPEGVQTVKEIFPEVDLKEDETFKDSVERYAALFNDHIQNKRALLEKVSLMRVLKEGVYQPGKKA